MKTKPKQSDTVDGLTLRDWQSAFVVQDACNLFGVLSQWKRIMSKLCEYGRINVRGTDWINKHPVNILFVDKIGSLTDINRGLAFSEAYIKVENSIKHLTPKE